MGISELPEVVMETKLTLLDISCNRFTTLPTAMRHVPSLATLNLADNSALAFQASDVLLLGGL